jgi:hypothetical protein
MNEVSGERIDIDVSDNVIISRLGQKQWIDNSFFYSIFNFENWVNWTILRVDSIELMKSHRYL